MSRTVASSLITAWAGDTAQPYFAVELALTSGTIRFWSGYGERTINGDTYIGAGQLVGITGLEEVADLSAKAVTVSLNGVPGELISLALQEPYQRRKCRVYFGDVTAVDVVEVFTGRLNKMTIEDTAETGVIDILVDSKMVEAEKASNRRYTSASQKSRHSTDTFFDYVAAIQDAEIVWGRNG